MSDRMATLERVAEAARAWRKADPYHCGKQERDISAALNALDALPAEPAGETVEVRVGLWRNPHNKGLHAEIIDGADDAESGAWKRIATITARVPLPTIPTVAARVVATDGEMPT